MKKPILLAALAFVVSLAAQAASVEDIPRKNYDPKRSSCDLAVDFGSECCGIDMQAFQPVTDYILASKTINRARRYSLGREGEKTYCLSIEGAENAKAVLSDIEKLLPANPGHPSTFVSMPKSAKP